MSKTTPDQGQAAYAEPGRIISATDFARMTATSAKLRRVQSAQLTSVETMHRSAWALGYRHGLRQAMSELSDFCSETQRRRVDAASPIKKIVFTVLRKVLHESDSSQLMASIAERVVAESCEQLESVTILVHPEVAESVALRFAKHKVPGMRIDVQAAEHIEVTGCEIQTVFGIIDAGLDVQLDALEHCVRRVAADAHDA